MNRIAELFQHIESRVHRILDEFETPEINIDATLDGYEQLRAELQQDIVRMRAVAEQMQKDADLELASRERWDKRGIQAGEGGHEDLAREALAQSQAHAARREELLEAVAKERAGIDKLAAILDDLTARQNDLARNREVLAARAALQQMGADLSEMRQDVDQPDPAVPPAQPPPQGAAQSKRDIAALERDFDRLDSAAAEERAREKLAAMKAKMRKD
ncbi:MAG: PspA/IM30 family protein [Acidobacteriota bacterium]|nr:PspA/IM30 family protein [Acidobacteriota bacterium]